MAKKLKKPVGSKPHHFNIEKETLKNTNYRKVVYTDKYQQLVLMSLNPKEYIYLEKHNATQFFRVEKGNGIAKVGGKDIKLKDGVSVTVPPNTFHKIINTGSVPLKLYTIYSPPQHKPGTVDKRQPTDEKAGHTPDEYLKDPEPTVTIYHVLDKYIVQDLQQLLQVCWKGAVVDKYIGDSRWFVIEKGVEILAAGRLDADNTLWSLCTATDHRGRGYAGKIINKMLDTLCTEGDKVMKLFLEEGGPEKWYKKLGFERVNMDRDEIDKYKDRVNVRKMARQSCRK
tara:strand:+ start:382 stop:1233 length:852 start_codon:yes stop_codon:yes gene_type:complete